MITLLKSGFYKDLLILFLITVLIGGSMASGIAYAVDSYFGDTMTSYMGDYGEYDVIVHVKQEYSKTAFRELKDLIKARLHGGLLDKGIVLAGKANYLVALPAAAKKRETFESLGSLFGRIPGYDGYTIITEPRITVRGMQPTSVDFFKGKFDKVKGVLFSYISESGIDLVLENSDQVQAVTNNINTILNGYQLIETRFPIGYEIKDVSSVGEHVVNQIKDELGVNMVRDISLGGTNPDMQHFIRTMGEMRRFLMSYATEVSIPISMDMPLSAGDVVILAPKGTTLKIGEKVYESSVLAKVISFSKGMAKALIISGDAGELNLSPGNDFADSVNSYKVSSYTSKSLGKVSTQLNKATIYSRRMELDSAINESIKLLLQLEKVTLEASKSTNEAAELLDRYEVLLEHIGNITNVLSSTDNVIEDSVTGLDSLRSGELRRFISESNVVADGISDKLNEFRKNQSDLNALYNDISNVKQEIAQNPQGIDPAVAQMVSSLQKKAKIQLAGIDTATKSFSNTMEILKQWQNRLPLMSLSFASVDVAAKQRLLLSAALKKMAGATNDSLSKLRSIDIGGIRSNVKEASGRLRAIDSVDADLIISQLQRVQSSLPSLRDEDIGRSIGLIDEYLKGQVIPGERVMILTQRGVPAEYVGQIVREQTGIDKLVILSTSTGTVQPDVRGQLARVLKDIRGIISGGLSIVITLMVLVLDYSTILSACKLVKRYGDTTRRQKLINRLANSPDIFGMLIGGLLAYGMAFVSRGRFPYLGIWGSFFSGIVLGFLVSRYSERMSPVDNNEMLGGQSLGLSATELMRQIAIPEGRPGLLMILNKRRLLS